MAAAAITPPASASALDHPTSGKAGTPKVRALVFSKTAGFRHTSIEPGVSALKELGAENGFKVDATEDAAAFTSKNLSRYDAVVFLSTTGDVLDEAQQQAFEGYIHDGGGYAGIHAAADTEYDWPFYGKLVGAYFLSHPLFPKWLQDARVDVVDRTHPSTRHLPFKWTKFDELYDYRVNPRGKVHVLMTLDERTYDGGKTGADHPIAWCRNFAGGRSWYTGLGHTDESYSDPLFLKHVLGGIQWAAGVLPGDCRSTVDSSFRKVVLNDEPGEPMALAVLPDRRVLSTSRNGDIRLNHPKSKRNTFAAHMPVYDHDEDGLQSIAIDPNFKRNRWVYLYYAPLLDTPVDDPSTPIFNEGDAPTMGTRETFEPYRGVNRLSRFKLYKGRIVRKSEQRIIDVPVDRGICCHVGGHVDFDGRGNLLLSTGDDTLPFASGGYTPIEERTDSTPALDAQRSAANTNDLRGKLLRIHPRKDRGGYTIPKGNLFAKGKARTRPEVYAMGLRNPFRFSVNRRTNVVYLADYSPDAGQANPLRGPAGNGKWTVIRRPGNYGWPYCATAKLPYVDYDFGTLASGAPFDCAHPVNDSPHNTGLRELPPTVQPDVWYSYGPSAEFPGIGGNTGVGPMAGPAYDPKAAGKSRTRWPDYYAGAPIFYEWTGDYVRAMRPAKGGGLARIEPLLTTMIFDNPMDMEFGPDGALYVLEYGDGYFSENPEAQLSRIDFIRHGRGPG
ncbi:MAG: ThuA domain-containing protein [Thermoleophilia bacterium]|nr:ThuA domain-containing protein [Thermoleophilia bacterium]